MRSGTDAAALISDLDASALTSARVLRYEPAVLMMSAQPAADLELERCLPSLLRLHKPAVLDVVQGPCDVRCILPHHDLEASGIGNRMPALVPPALMTSARCPWSCPRISSDMISCVDLVLVTFIPCPGGIMLVKLWLLFSWGSSSTGFTLSLLLPVSFT